MRSYTGWDGLQELCGNARGDEKIGAGIRPYGLHAGNLTALVAYPYLFFEYFQKTQKQEPRFTYQVWLNDIEPIVYVGADGMGRSADAANMYPGSTTFQFTAAPNGFDGSIVDYWQPAIEGIVRGTIGARFPQVKLVFHRASELVTTPEFQKTVLGAMKRASDLKEYIENNTRHRVRGSASFVWPLCPECHAPVLDVQVKRSLFKLGQAKIMGAHQADSSSRTPVDHKRFKETVTNLSWAVQFRMLQVARLAAEQPDVWIIGMDHIQTNRTSFLEDVAERIGVNSYRGKFLHTPLIFADGEKKLGKSLGNAIYISPFELIDALRENINPGLDVKFAPVSADIMAMGADFLPHHMRRDKRKRMRVLSREGAHYNKSDHRRAFNTANARNAVSRRFMGAILGVPHL